MDTPLGRACRLVLAGFMGSGKTTVGRLLSHRLGWSFADLDEHVATREGATVPALIAGRGEAGFRDLEVLALRDLLQRSDLLIALGGGTPETLAARRLLADSPGTLVVHLHAPFDQLYRRCQQQALDPLATQRPLLGEPGGAAARYTRRFPLYQGVAHLTVDVTESSPEQVVMAILRELGQQIEPGEHSRL